MNQQIREDKMAAQIKLTDAQKAQLKKAWDTDKERFLGHVAHDVLVQTQNGERDFEDDLSTGIMLGIIIGRCKSTGKTFDQFVEVLEAELTMLYGENQ